MSDIHRKGVALEVWGPTACFTRPEFGAERLSYPVITPSAAIGLIRNIYWHPGVEWRCTEIRICNPIRYYSSYGNEVSSHITAASVKSAAGGGGSLTPVGKTQQRYTTALRDCRYQLFFDFTIDKSKLPEDMPKDDESIALLEAKVISLTAKRLKHGACYKQPCLGFRKYFADFKALEQEDSYVCPEELLGEKDLGIILYSMDSNAPLSTAAYYHCVCHDGIIKVPQPDSEEVLRL